ncbi:MAG: AMP-binding protein, partial [Dehalococcoidia bacterium]|nr:AMP-binding protein [Dehalococcoidia bacterium]
GQQLGPNQVGEIVFRGSGMMKGYYNRPLATVEAVRNGWLFTGDLGKMDDDGNLFVVGRKKEMIKIGDREILPTDIEEVLGTHPKIAEVAVMGNDKGLKAVVVLKFNTRATAQDIINFARKQLRPEDVPDTIEFVTSLPRTLTGKIQRWALNK